MNKNRGILSLEVPYFVFNFNSRSQTPTPPLLSANVIIECPQGCFNTCFKAFSFSHSLI